MLFLFTFFEVGFDVEVWDEVQMMLLRWLAKSFALFRVAVLSFRVEANDGNNTGNGKFAHLAASSRT